MILHQGLVLGMAMAVLISGPATARADTPDVGTRDEILAAIEATQVAVRDGASAARFAGLLYAPDVVIVGEGEAGAKRGIEAAIAELEAHWASLGPDGPKRCRLTLSDDAVSSMDTYAAFGVLHCEPSPPAVMEAMDFRVLYVWKKLPQGWRVALEQWGLGSLN